MMLMMIVLPSIARISTSTAQASIRALNNTIRMIQVVNMGALAVVCIVTVIALISIQLVAENMTTATQQLVDTVTMMRM